MLPSFKGRRSGRALTVENLFFEGFPETDGLWCLRWCDSPASTGVDPLFSTAAPSPAFVGGPLLLRLALVEPTGPPRPPVRIIRTDPAEHASPEQTTRTTFAGFARWRPSLGSASDRPTSVRVLRPLVRTRAQAGYSPSESGSRCVGSYFDAGSRHGLPLIGARLWTCP